MWMRFEKRQPRAKKSGKEGQLGGCPACDGGWRTIQFSWKAALSQPMGEWGRYPRTLVRTRALKRGALYECPTCGQRWALDGAGETLSILPDEAFPLLEGWDSAPLDLSPDLWEKARAIGATPAHQYSQDKDYAELPCRVLTRKGESLDKCLITFSSSPPLADYQRNARLVTEVAGILPSDHALPRPVRLASSRSSEVRGMGPTYVRSADGRLFCLNWVVNFLDQKGALGRDMALVPQPPARRPPQTTLVTEELEKINFIIADWSPKVRELLA
jgi:hypothetical protein